MSKIGIDGHVLLGASGIFASMTLAGYSQIMASIAATATAGYMLLRCAREWLKLRRDEKEKPVHGFKNSKPNEP